MCVNVESHRGSAVADPVGNRPHIDARRHQHGDVNVPEVMERNPWKFGALDDLVEVSADDVVWVKRLAILRCEYEVKVEVPSSALQPS